MKPANETITLVGAGLNGPLLAILLRQRGFAVEIYERRPDMRQVRMSAGRSINLALSTRGIYGLQRAGLWEQMRSIVIAMKGRMMWQENLPSNPMAKTTPKSFIQFRGLS